MAADLDAGELGDAACERLTVGARDGIGARGARDTDGEHDERDGGERGDAAPRVQAPAPGGRAILASPAGEHLQAPGWRPG